MGLLRARQRPKRGERDEEMGRLRFIVRFSKLYSGTLYKQKRINGIDLELIDHSNTPEAPRDLLIPRGPN